MNVAPDATLPCPKCGRPHAPRDESCPRCGLTFSLWNPDVTPAPTTLDERGEALWAEILRDFPDEARHEAFAKHCAAKGLLGAAGRRYRERLDRDPGDPVAGRMRDRIVGMATAALAGLTRPVPAAPVTRSRLFWVVIVLFLIAGGMAGMLFARR